jgi:tetratricopeptide (TPR) repeat protein
MKSKVILALTMMVPALLFGEFMDYEGTIIELSSGIQFGSFSGYNTGLLPEKISYALSGYTSALKELDAPLLFNFSTTAVFDGGFFGPVGAAAVFGYAPSGNESSVFYASGSIREKRTVSFKGLYSGAAVKKYFDAFYGFAPFVAMEGGVIFSINNYVEKETYNPDGSLLTAEIDDINGVIPSLAAEAGINYNFGAAGLFAKLGYRAASADIKTKLRSNDFLVDGKEGVFKCDFSGIYMLAGVSMRFGNIDIKNNTLTARVVKKMQPVKTAAAEKADMSAAKSNGAPEEAEPANGVKEAAAAEGTVEKTKENAQEKVKEQKAKEGPADDPGELMAPAAPANVADAVKQAKSALGYETYRDTRSEKEKIQDYAEIHEVAAKMTNVVEAEKSREKAVPALENKKVEAGPASVKTVTPSKKVRQRLVQPIMKTDVDEKPLFADPGKEGHMPEKLPTIEKSEPLTALSKQGDAEFINKEYGPAADFYKKALKIKNSAVINKKLGNCYYYLGDKVEALRYYKVSLKLNPDDAELKEFINEIK